MQYPRFSKANSSNFSKTLRQKVNQYFKNNQLSKKADRSMVIKTIVMIVIFITPIIILSTGVVASPLLLFVLYLTSGAGMAGIGMGVMHDANHGAYSKKRSVNRALGLTMNLIGANANMWKIQHNVLHHTYTNIQDADEDIKVPFFLRFSPYEKRYWIHRFQHIYVWLFYGLSTIAWITANDFKNLKHYRNLGFIKTKKEFNRQFMQISGWKLFYYAYALVLPMIMLPLSPWLVVLAFLTMHFVTGVVVTTVFQTAHVMPDAEYPLPDENGVIANDWTIHEMVTTTNFAPGNKLLSWYIGGLNYQIEHHLLPNICHVHYNKIASIVAETAHEYGIPYHIKPSFRAAIKDHVKMLRDLGRQEPLPAYA